MLLHGLKTIVLIGLCISANLYAQDSVQQKRMHIKGNLADYMSATFIEFDSKKYIDQQLQGRVQADWKPLPWLETEAALRSRFIYGETVKELSGLYSQWDKDPGKVDLSTNMIENNSCFWNVNIDRAFMHFLYKSAELTVGRQRINWGQTFAWNPNDIFNTYSFYDLEYPERPGCDALRFQYFTAAASSVEAAMSLDALGKTTTCLLWKFHVGNYDLQCLAGNLKEHDWALGMGWSGNIKSNGFRGEVSYFHPSKSIRDTSGIWAASLGFDRSFSNQLSLVMEAFFQSKVSFFNEAGHFLQSAPASPKSLSFTEYNLLLQLSYPITPLLSGSMTVIYYPKMDGYYLGPAIEYSLLENLDLGILFQRFSLYFDKNTFGNSANPYLLTYNMGEVRLRWNF